VHTALYPADAVLEVDGFALKLESLQHAGSFKTRGAFANLLSREIPPAGVVAASGGNHGAAVAYAAMTLGVPAVIFVPTVSSPAKIARIESYGARIVVGGDRYSDAYDASLVHIAETVRWPCTLSIRSRRCAVKGRSRWSLRNSYPSSTRCSSRWAAAASSVASRVVRKSRQGRRRRAGRRADVTRRAGRGPTGGCSDRQHRERLARPAPRRRADVPDRPTLSSTASCSSPTTTSSTRGPRSGTDARRYEPGGVAAFAAVHSSKYRPGPEERVGVVISGANTMISWP